MRNARGRYRGETLRAVAMPLGGLGTGTIALAGDGSLRQWQIHNQINHIACVPHSFFAVRAQPIKPFDEPVVRVLQSAALFDPDGPTAPPTSNDHVVPSAQRELLRELPGVAAIEFTGEYPIAELTYLDDVLPLDVSMEAFNPFVPIRSEDSGIPTILVNLTVTNPDGSGRPRLGGGNTPERGWLGRHRAISDTRCPRYGGNSNGLLRLGEQTVITMGNAWLPEDDARWGTMALAVGDRDATYLTQWDDLRSFWDDFATDGRLSNVADTTPSAAGPHLERRAGGADAVATGRTRTVEFTLAWHFPNRYVNYSQRSFLRLRGRQIEILARQPLQPAVSLRRRRGRRMSIGSATELTRRPGWRAIPSTTPRSPSR